MSSRTTRTKNISDKFRTWIEVDRASAKYNYGVFHELIGARSRVKLWSVVKSNAYGHGLTQFAAMMQRFGVDGFCVDSVVEGFRLREEGIVKPILVLGLTLPIHMKDAAAQNITLTISNISALRALAKQGARVPDFHIKIDSGMHRQGFYPEDIPSALALIKSSPNLHKHFTGAYTHFSSAKDVTYPGYAEFQAANFNRALAAIRKAGYRNIIRHAAATGGAMLDAKYHFDAVRVGIGMYGVYPSSELAIQRANLDLKPVLSWRTIIGEVKAIKKGAWIGYDGAERMPRDGRIAILPVGYWHGFPRALSHVGEVLIHGRRAKVMGRVSMDLLIVDITKIPAKPGDVVTLIGRDRNEVVAAEELAQKAGTSAYEILTRVNPLIERIDI